MDFCNKLLGATAENECACLCVRASAEQVVTLRADLTLLKGAAGSQMHRLQVIDSGLNGTADSLDNTGQIVDGNTSSAKDVAVGEVLSRQIANGELG